LNIDNSCQQYVIVIARDRVYYGICFPSSDIFISIFFEPLGEATMALTRLQLSKKHEKRNRLTKVISCICW